MRFCSKYMCAQMLTQWEWIIYISAECVKTYFNLQNTHWFDGDAVSLRCRLIMPLLGVEILIENDALTATATYAFHLRCWECDFTFRKSNRQIDESNYFDAESLNSNNIEVLSESCWIPW